MFSFRHPRSRRTHLTRLMPEAQTERVGAEAKAFNEACVSHDFTDGVERGEVRQRGEPAPEAPRAQPGSPQLNNDALAIRMAKALQGEPRDILGLQLRRWAVYRKPNTVDPELPNDVLVATVRGLEEILDADAVRLERVRRGELAIVDAVAQMQQRAPVSVDTSIDKGATRIIREPWRLDRLPLWLWTDRLANWPLDRLRDWLAGQLLHAERFQRESPERADMCGNGSRIMAIKQAQRALAIAERAGGWAAARAELERRESPVIAAE